VKSSSLSPVAKLFLVVALLISLLCSFFLRAFVVRSSSMRPTLLPNEVVLVEHFSRHLLRDQVYAFRVQDRWLLKRLVGVPGDAVALRGKRLLRNGSEVSEPYVQYLRGGILDFPADILPPGELLFLGDNRDISQDSRSFGAVARSRLAGRVFFRIWPLGRLGMVR
jgi:signal peptidase I